jgi:hypothetical protein
MPRIFGEQPREGSNEVPKLILPASGYENKPLTNEEKEAQNNTDEIAAKKSLAVSNKKFAEKAKDIDLIKQIEGGQILSSGDYGRAHIKGMFGGKIEYREGGPIIIGQEKIPSPSPESRPDSVEAKEKFNKEQTEKEIAKLKQEINKEASVRAKRDFAGYNPDGSITLDLEKNFKVFESGEKFREEYLKEVRKKIALDECALSIQKRWEEEFKKKNLGLSEDEMLAKIEEAKKDPKIKTERIKFTQDLEKARKEIRENYGIKIPRGVYYKMIEYGEQIDKLKVSKGKITIPTTNGFENRFDSFEELAEHSKDYGRFFEEGVAERMADEKIEEKLDAKIKTGKERWQEKKREKVAELTNDVNLGKKIEETEDIIPFSEIKKPEIKSTSVLDETPKNPAAEAGDTVVNKKEAGDTSTTLPETKKAEELPQEIEISEESKKMVIKLLRAEAEKLIDSNAAEALALEETVNKLEGNTTGPETRENVVFLLNLLEAGKSAENFEARKELAENLGGKDLEKVPSAMSESEIKKEIDHNLMQKTWEQFKNLSAKETRIYFKQLGYPIKKKVDVEKITKESLEGMLLTIAGEKGINNATFYAFLSQGYAPYGIKEKGIFSKTIEIPGENLEINVKDFEEFKKKTREKYDAKIKGLSISYTEDFIESEIAKIIEAEKARQEAEEAKRELEEKNNPKLVEPVVTPAVAEIPPTPEITPAKTIESLEDKIKNVKTFAGLYKVFGKIPSEDIKKQIRTARGFIKEIIEVEGRSKRKVMSEISADGPIMSAITKAGGLRDKVRELLEAEAEELIEERKTKV